MFSKLGNVHNNAIFNFAWAEPEMKLVTACGDQTSKLFSVTPSGALVEIKMFSHNSSVKTVMFCPGSSGTYKYSWFIYLFVCNLVHTTYVAINKQNFKNS